MLKKETLDKLPASLKTQVEINYKQIELEKFQHDAKALEIKQMEEKNEEWLIQIENAINSKGTPGIIKTAMPLPRGNPANGRFN